MAKETPASHQVPTYLDYLEIREKAERLTALASMIRASSPLPIALASDLLLLDLGLDEKLKVLEATGSRDHVALEHFLTSNLLIWPQELAALALRIWSTKTHHLFWFRIAEAIKSPALPQRVFYTALDVAEHAGGRQLIQLACHADGIESMSEALHGLILQRAVQWSVPHPRLETLAQNILSRSRGNIHPEDKSLPSAVAYLARFRAESLETETLTRQVREPWVDLLHAVVSDLKGQSGRVTQLKTLAKKTDDPQLTELYIRAWPALWSRHQLDHTLVAAGLRYLPPYLDFFSGIAEDVLTQALVSIQDTEQFAKALVAVTGLLSVPSSQTVLDALKDRIAAATDPAQLLDKIPLRLRLDLTTRQSGSKTKIPHLAAIHQEEAAVLSGQTHITRAICTEDAVQESASAASSAPSPTTDDQGRRMFFDLAYRQLNTEHRGLRAPKTKSQGAAPPTLWALLDEAWRKPDETQLSSMASAARQTRGVLRLCYIDTLGRFQGQDAAALKLLDFIRSTEEDDLRAVIRALGGIGTARAAQELVSALTRPNITTALQIEACTALRRLNLEPLQAELRATLNDLSLKPAGDGQGLELREALVALLIPSQATDHTPPPSAPILGDRELDQTLGGTIPYYKELSTEVRRALRTSLFFHKQVEDESAPDSIDLSPVIDMQYKALELLFRETFDDECSRLIQRGTLQRRLDVIGYARPVPHAMDDFEAYIASLPVVREIPFFSKFKLRKTLRAICQFRPGKRFTLDGLKAFAIFFLCFSRSECQYGLANMFPLGLANDLELFEFCKSLHIFQDFRNRAAHEGFHPDAAQDMEGIWRQTAEIIQGLSKARRVPGSSGQSDDSSRARGNGPQAEKKVS